jgi:hypothetical protein
LGWFVAAAPEVLTREQCGLRPENPARLSERVAGQLMGVTVHVTVTPAADPIHTWQKIQAEYMDGNNVNHAQYGDIPYNDGVTMDGRILSGRRHHWVGAHAASSTNVANRTTLGLVVIGTGATITPAAERAIRFYLFFATHELGHRPPLFDHYDWRAAGGIATSCPDPAIAAFVNLLRAEARAGH